MNVYSLCLSLLMEKDIFDILQLLSRGSLASKIPRTNDSEVILILHDVLSRRIDELAKYFECSKEEIYIGNYTPDTSTTVCPYRVIIGNASFTYSNIVSLGNLSHIYGDANFCYSKIVSLGNLSHIYGNANFCYSNIVSLGNLSDIYGNVNFSYSIVDNNKFLRNVGGDISVNYSIVPSLSESLLEKTTDTTYSLLNSDFSNNPERKAWLISIINEARKMAMSKSGWNVTPVENKENGQMKK